MRITVIQFDWHYAVFWRLGRVALCGVAELPYSRHSERTTVGGSEESVE